MHIEIKRMTVKEETANYELRKVYVVRIVCKDGRMKHVIHEEVTIGEPDEEQIGKILEPFARRFGVDCVFADVAQNYYFAEE